MANWPVLHLTDYYYGHPTEAAIGAIILPIIAILSIALYLHFLCKFCTHKVFVAEGPEIQDTTQWQLATSILLISLTLNLIFVIGQCLIYSVFLFTDTAVSCWWSQSTVLPLMRKYFVCLFGFPKTKRGLVFVR